MLVRIGSLLPGSWGNDGEENVNHDEEFPNDDVGQNEHDASAHENQFAPRCMMQFLLHPVCILLRSDPNSSAQGLRRILTGDRADQVAQGM